MTICVSFNRPNSVKPQSQVKTEPRSNEKVSLDECLREAKPGLVREFVDFLLHNKKWWLIPILIMVLLLGLLVVAAGSGAAPFIYTLF